METEKYWCYICEKKVTSNSDSICAKCNNPYIEEIEQNDVPSDFKINKFSFNGNNTQQSTLQRNISVQIISNSGLIGPTFLNNVINLSNAPFFQNFNLNIGNIGPFLGRHNNDQQFENLLNFIMQNDPNQYGTPPASKEVIQNLSSCDVIEKNVQNFSEETCLICQEGYDVGNTIVKLYCAHIFHKSCILEWLKLHNNCPVCRYEMPTDNEDFENRKNQVRNNLRNVRDN